MRKQLMFGAALVLAATITSYAELPTAGGTYNWEDYLPASGRVDMRTTGQTGDQTWVVQQPHTALNPFYPGQTDTVDWWQIFTGAKLGVSGTNFRVMKGNIVFENKVTSETTDNYIGYTGAAKLVLRNGGSFMARTDHVRIGNTYSGTPNSGTVFMEEPSALTVSNKNLVVASSGPGALWVDGGVVSATNGALSVGDGSYEGYLRQNGGTVSLRSDTVGDTALLGGGTTAYSSVHIAGGTFMTRKTDVPSEVYFKVGCATNKATDIYVDGGVLDMWNERFGLGYWSSGVTGGRATLTVDGDGLATFNLLALGRSGSGNASIINMNGGRLEVSRSFSTYGNANNARWLNFDGGVFAPVYDSRTGFTGSLGVSWPTVVYPNGGTVDVSSGTTATIAPAFRSAGGWGVSAITLSSAGSGYVTAPQVTITGGSGSNATAYAVLNKDRTIGKIVVTCRGEGYAQGDTLTVSVTSATGSGAAAAAVLAENTRPTLRKTGAGTWTQKGVATGFDGDLEANEGTLSFADGGGFPSATVKVGASAYLSVPRTTTATNSTLGTVVAKVGYSEILTSGSSGTAALTIGTFSREPAGLMGVASSNGLALTVQATEYISTSANRGVLNGIIYSGMDGGLLERAPDGTVTMAATSSTVENDDTVLLSSGGTFTCAKLNGVVLEYAQLYLTNDAPVEIQSGMIYRRASGIGLVRCSASSSGSALTTRAKGGMVVFERSARGRSNSQSTGGDDGNNPFFDKDGSRRFIVGPFCDPDASTPMTLTIGGFKQNRPDFGALAWIINSEGRDTYSGGLCLVNGGVVIEGDYNLGASGAPVKAKGPCIIVMRNGTFAISDTRTVEILPDSALMFSPLYGDSGNTVAAKLSGSGDLLTADFIRRGYAMAYTGDHSAFTGDYYVLGHMRTPPSVFAANAGICLADGTNGVGVIETSGSFARPAGTGKGEICWKAHASMPASYGLRGGFAARGGDFTVNLGGAGTKLAVGSEYLPDGALIQFQSQYADGALTFANGFELGGKTQQLSVWSGKTTTLSGDVSDAVGGGQLGVTGDLVFAGTLEVTGENLAAGEPLLAVTGNLDLTAAQIDMLADVEALEAYKKDGVVLASATGIITGTPVFKNPRPGAWTLKTEGGTLSLVPIRGTVIKIL